MVKVVKFGGSSLASAKQFLKVIDIIKEDENRRYVIPSAPGKRNIHDEKVTDMLYKTYSLAKEEKDFDKDLEEIKKRYEEIILGLNLDLNFDKEFELIKEDFLNKKGEDYAASRGEYLNSLIMSKALDFEFIDAKDVIFFDENNNFDAEKTNTILAKILKGTKNAVIPGFYGSDINGNIKTFSRGGSDISGAIVARAIKADIYENWTDVSGFLVVDPKIISNPEPIDTITYKELRELSYMGASVLHEEAIFPVKKEGIPINIKNTNKKEDKGTMIVDSTSKIPAYTITGIAGKKGFCSINIDKAMMNSEIGFCMRVLQVFDKYQIPIEHMPSGIDTMSVIVEQAEFEDKEQEVVLSINKIVSPDSVEIETGIALIAVVGRAMKEKRGTAARIFAALAHKNINVKMIDQGSSECNIIIGVNEQDFEAAIHAIYEIFIILEL